MSCATAIKGRASDVIDQLRDGVFVQGAPGMIHDPEVTKHLRELASEAFSSFVLRATRAKFHPRVSS
ncbi:MAG TPA: hypothetical protein VMB34_32160 [Acetobacteraceae bacterium]|nr:hypothetical protein [Acetobacteraceae bacterium]